MQQDKSEDVILGIIGLVFIIWIGLLVAPFIGGGLPEIIKNFNKVIEKPFKITICRDSFKTVLFLILFYGIGISIYISNKKNYRKREEHGSAKWGNVKTISSKYRQRPRNSNKILTQNAFLGLNGRKHRRNLNVLVCGGSGAGKTRFYCKPNIMQCNTSFVILDPKRRTFEGHRTVIRKKGI